VCLCLDRERVEFSDHYGLRGSSEYKLLHCTAFYVGGHGTASSERYAQLGDVCQSVGKSFSLAVTGIVITPNTVCARVDLTGDLRYFHRLCVDCFCLQFSALTLLVGHQEEHPACKKLSDEVLAWLSV